MASIPVEAKNDVVTAALPPQPPAALVHPPPPRISAEDKPVVPMEPKPIDSTAPALPPSEKIPATEGKKPIKGSHDRDVALGELEKERMNSFVKAWEESEKSKVENKAQKKLSDINAWENSKKGALEAQLKKFEDNLEMKKAKYAEKMKNNVSAVHKQAEERRAMVEAQRGEELLKAEETAAKYRATGTKPKKVLGCF